VNENSLIKDIGRSYIVSSVLPAGLFIALGVIFYQDFIFSSIINEATISNLSVGLVVFLLTVAIMWIGFALFSMVNWTVRLYEGYYLPGPLSGLLLFLFYRRAHRRKTKNIQKVIKANREFPPDRQETIAKYYDQAWADYGDVELSVPIREEDLLPSKLGNVLRASEQYSAKYGLTAGINLWTRLAVLLPPEMANSLEEKNNNMMFLLNSSLLAYAHGLIAIVISIAHYSTKSRDIFMNHLVLAAVCFFAGYSLYIMSVPVAKTMGLLIRSSFDLYRFDLLEQLNYSIPTTLSQERKLWLKVSDFIVTAGNLGWLPLEFEYNLHHKYLPEHPRNKKSSSKSSKVKKI